jgi:hypothetical protein
MTEIATPAPETKMSQLRKLIAETKAQVKALGKEALTESLQGLFAAHPELVAVRWAQYTPYFADGDPCVFGVNEVYHRTSSTPEDDGDYEDGFVTPPWRDEEQTEMTKALRAFAGDLDKAICLEAFGDHCQVTATRDGITVDEYSHD